MDEPEFNCIEYENLPDFAESDKKENTKEAMDLSNIENALLTVAESIKYLADTYAEVNKAPESPTDHLKPINPWRPAQKGDLIRLTGVGSDLARMHTGEIVRVTRAEAKRLVHWETLDGITKTYDSGSGSISNSDSRLTVME